MDDLVRLLNLLGAADVGKTASAGAVNQSGSANQAAQAGLTCGEFDPPIAIATVVNTRGSAYRRPGARMIVRRSMAVQGSVSAGCLERDIIAHCEGLEAEDKPLLLTYDGTSSDELIFGLKLGCDGIVQVLLEPLSGSDKSAGQKDKSNAKFAKVAQLLPDIFSRHRRVVAVTVFDLTGDICDEGNGQSAAAPKSFSIGTVMLETGFQTYELAALPRPVSNLLRQQAQQALQNPHSRSFVTEQAVEGYTVSALLEIVEPITTILVCGAGQDVDPLVEMAGVLGWRVNLATGSEIDKIEIDSHISAAVIMTHDYERDRKILKLLFTAYEDLPYIGVVGPRRRTDKLLAELALEGVSITPSHLARLFSPVGLDLGAERPEEIALSILSEIKAVLAGHRGGSLREKQGPIHEPTEIKTVDTDLPGGAPGGEAVEKRRIGLVCGLNNE